MSDEVTSEGLLGEIRARREKAQPIVDDWMLSSSTIALGRLDTYTVCLSQMDVRTLLALVDELQSVATAAEAVLESSLFARSAHPSVATMLALRAALFAHWDRTAKEESKR